MDERSRTTTGMSRDTSLWRVINALRSGPARLPLVPLLVILFTFGSPSAQAKKADQTITFAAPSDKTYGDAPFSVSATASSGLTVTLSTLTSSVCAISGNFVTLTGGGTCTIRASQVGNAKYNAAPNVDRSFAVAKANQTLTFDPVSDQSLLTPLVAVHTSTSSGLYTFLSSLTPGVCEEWRGVGDSPQSALATQEFIIVLRATGACTLLAEQPGNNAYNAASSVSRSFNVTGAQASQTITFGVLSDRTYGDSPFTVRATASSGLPVTFGSVTASVCTVNSDTVTTIAAGPCTIQATQSGNATYAPATAVDQSFIAAKAN